MADTLVETVEKVLAEAKAEAVKSAIIKGKIAEYEQQYAGMEQQLSQLEANYQQQKTLAINTLNQLAGAVTALKQLLEVPAEETK